MFRKVTLTALAGLAAVACRAEPLAPPISVYTQAPDIPSDEALLERVTALVQADPECVLADNFLPREVVAVDLGGRTGVIVECANGMVDVFSRLYVAAGDETPVKVPLLVFGFSDSEKWSREDALPT
ncbi:hypothetical protein [Brevundimonas sp. LM2]|uniref:hypothetical protein n=1 Tax=Brevundimonas sp. LM2 TaxID=1938605 RepID=UPI0012375415|nr:hypothetical protein [Brevundimonas sp. LM2]